MKHKLECFLTKAGFRDDFLAHGKSPVRLKWALIIHFYCVPKQHTPEARQEQKGNHHRPLNKITESYLKRRTLHHEEYPSIHLIGFRPNNAQSPGAVAKVTKLCPLFSESYLVVWLLLWLENSCGQIYPAKEF